MLRFGKLLIRKVLHERGVLTRDRSSSLHFRTRRPRLEWPNLLRVALSMVLGANCERKQITGRNIAFHSLTEVGPVLNE
jgi:hypothetical protein